MTDYQIAIPSYRRSKTLSAKTLPLLVAGGVDPQRINVFVANNEERAEYAATLAAGTYRQLVVGEPGMGKIRNVSARHYEPGTKLLQLDDDLVRFIARRTAQKATAITDLDALFRTAFDLADRVGLSLWGFYPVPNPYFMRDRVRTDLTYIIGAVFGYTVRGDETELVFCDDKEDYERSVRFYMRDGGVLRIESVSFETQYYTEPGGMQTYRTAETIEAGARYMASTYPDFATYRVSKSRGTAELRLRDKRSAT